MDQRGFLERMFCREELESIVGGRTIAQINRTLTYAAGTVRGMHYQYPPYAETKIVSCTKGEVYDVAVDLRRGSGTFLRWHAEVLSENNNKTFVIPEGFAHGFQTLTDNCEMIYFHTAPYSSKAEGVVNVIDPRVAIHWPLPISGQSPRDLSAPLLTEEFGGVIL